MNTFSDEQRREDRETSWNSGGQLIYSLILCFCGLFIDTLKHNAGSEASGLQPGGVYHHQFQKYLVRDSESLKNETGSQRDQPNTLLLAA